jgi:hypothetical protein
VGAVLGVPQHRAHATAKPPQQRAIARLGKITKTNTTPTAMPTMAPVESDEDESPEDAVAPPPPAVVEPLPPVEDVVTTHAEEEVDPWGDVVPEEHDVQDVAPREEEYVLTGQISQEVKSPAVGL